MRRLVTSTPKRTRTGGGWRWRSSCLLLLVAGTGTTGVLSGQIQIPFPQVTWNRMLPDVDNRHGHALAFDAARNVTVMFGGRRDTLIPLTLGDTWTFDGTSWTRQSPANSPVPRYGHSVAYDSIRQRVVLFGGNDASGILLNDTWEWDGSNWAQQSPAASPSARSEHGMAYDSFRGETVLFGGLTGASTPNQETWVYNGTTWTQRAPTTSPSARSAHSLTFDAPRSVTMLFGGLDAAGVSGQTWEWNGTNWVQQNPALSPAARQNHAAAYRAIGVGLITVFGGQGATALGDTWEWDGSNKTWTRSVVPGPIARSGHAMAYHNPASGVQPSAILFGGGATTNAPRSDTWSWDGASWVLISAGNPPARVFPVLSTGPFGAGTAQYLFGGNAGFASPSSLSDTWRWDGTNWSELSPATSPPARSFHTMSHDSSRGFVVLFGGIDASNNVLSDTWELNGTTWAQQAPATSPGARSHHGQAFDSSRNVTVLFGGRSQTTIFGDTWHWDGTNWTRMATTGPVARAAHTMAYDIARGVTVLFGGSDSAGPRNDTWEWNGTSWTQMATAVSPPAIPDPEMAYDSGRRRMVLHTRSASVPETWEYDFDPNTGLTNWIKRSASPAGTAAALHSMAYDRARQRTVLFGGLTFAQGSSSQKFSDETWEYYGTLPATVTSFGTGCMGSSSVPVCTAAPGPGNLPYIGYTFTTEVNSVPANNIVVLYYGVTRFNPPIDLTGAGMPGCFLYNSTEVPVTLVANAAGVATNSYTINIDPTLVGQNLYNQALVFDNPNTTTNALELRLGLK